MQSNKKKNRFLISMYRISKCHCCLGIPQRKDIVWSALDKLSHGRTRTIILLGHN
jgi:hypothetical protein